MTTTPRAIVLPHPVAHIFVGDDTEDVFTADQLRAAVEADREAGRSAPGMTAGRVKLLADVFAEEACDFLSEETPSNEQEAAYYDAKSRLHEAIDALYAGSAPVVQPVRAVACALAGGQSWDCMLGAYRIRQYHKGSYQRGDRYFTAEEMARADVAAVNAELSGGVNAFGCDAEIKGHGACHQWCGSDRCAHALATHAPSSAMAASADVAKMMQEAKLWISKVVIAAHRRSPAQTKVTVEALEAFIDALGAAATQPAPALAREPLSYDALNELARQAQIKFCLDKASSFELAFARLIERAHGITADSARPTEWHTPPASWRLLAKAAINLLCAIDEKHDTQQPPLKYAVPYGAVNDLRSALGAADSARASASEPPEAAEVGS